MRQLPSGTVTFLFSDIEGSTKLLDELGAEAYAQALAEHRRVMRDAFTARGGVEVDTQGDAFFVAFPTAAGALGAARDAQAALTSGPIRVRMGIHSGEPLVTEEGYVGIDVHRGARVMSAGHGGQVLVSAEAFALLDGELELVELGRHRLKDLTEPQPLYQLGTGEFPPLKTLYQTNLPVQPTPLVGRERELQEVQTLLEQSRLVTLTGAGGSGKTRLALQVAAELVDEHEDGVWWVPLAAIRDHMLVEPTISQTLGAKESLSEHVRSKKLLLLLDNFEQVLEAAPFVGELLAQALDVRILVTSRERVALAGEQEYPVPTLSPPEGIALFTLRARQLKPGFQPDEHLEEICRRLDGLPLALELAAARIKLLTTEQILGHLGHSLDLLTAGGRDAAERHRTLRATMEWSHELLNPDEQALFRSLAVFAGSFDLDAAEAICEADLETLGALIDKSLLRQTEDGRFFLLETIREFAAEQLDASPGVKELERGHAGHYLAVAQEAEPETKLGARETLERLERDHDNFRAALTRLLRDRDGVRVLELAGALLYFWWAHGHGREGRRWTEAGLEMAEHAPEHVRANALDGVSYFAFMMGDRSVAKTAAEESLKLWRELDDLRGMARALNELGLVAVDEGEYDEAKVLFRESHRMDRQRGAHDSAAMTTINLADVALREGNFEEAAALCDEARPDAVRHDRKPVIATTELFHGFADLGLGCHGEARDRFTAVLADCQDLGFPDIACEALEGVAAVESAAGNHECAVQLLGAVVALRSELGALAGFNEKRADALQAYARAKLGDEATTELLAKGRDMSLDQAIEFAVRPPSD